MVLLTDQGGLRRLFHASPALSSNRPEPASPKEKRPLAEERPLGEFRNPSAFRRDNGLGVGR